MIGTRTARDLRETVPIPARDRLLDEIQAVGLERADGLERARPVPALVGVDAKRDAGSDRLPEPPDSFDVVGHRVRGRLDLEDAVAERDLRASLRDLRVRALDGERPRQRHALAHAPPEQAVHGNAERLAVEIPERHLDGGAREGVALYPSRHLAVQRLDPGCVATDEPRRDVARDPDRDRLRRLFAPRRAAEARGFSPAREAVRRLEAHEGEIDR